MRDSNIITNIKDGRRQQFLLNGKDTSSSGGLCYGINQDPVLMVIGNLLQDPEPEFLSSNDMIKTYIELFLLLL